MLDSGDQNPKRLEIKKYANRRYYDTTHSRHLTLEEIRALIQQGYDIRAVDGKTSADITAQVLTQIILELDTPKLDSLPVGLLIRLIRMNDPLIKDFVEKYFNQALKSFFDYQQQLEEQIRRAHGLPQVFPPISAWAQAMLNPFGVNKQTGPEAPANSTPPPQPPAAAAETRELRELIRKLEQQIADLQKGNVRNKPAKPAPRPSHRGRKP